MPLQAVPARRLTWPRFQLRPTFLARAPWVRLHARLEVIFARHRCRRKLYESSLGSVSLRDDGWLGQGGEVSGNRKVLTQDSSERRGIRGVVGKSCRCCNRRGGRPTMTAAPRAPSWPQGCRAKACRNDHVRHWGWSDTLGRIHHTLYVRCREQAGCEASPTAAIVEPRGSPDIDSRSVKGARRDIASVRRVTTRAEKPGARSATSLRAPKGC